MTDSASPTDLQALLVALRLGDSFFPSGRYTLSHGLESFVRHHKVRDAAGLELLLEDFLTEAAGRSEAVAVASANRFAHLDDLHKMVEVDKLLYAMRLPSETSASATRTGRQLVISGRKMGCEGPFRRYAAEVDAGRTPGTHAVAFGALSASWGLTPLQATMVELYAYVSGLVGVALRTMRVTHIEGQIILRNLGPAFVSTAETAVMTDYEDMSAFAPLVEVMQMDHEREHLRLFAS